jgi:hypothetical protein
MWQLELQDLSAGYGLEEVIHKINLKLSEPSIYVVLGSQMVLEPKITGIHSFLAFSLVL